MRVRVTKSYLWAPDGIHVRTVEVGEELEGEGAQVALDMESGEELSEPEAGVSEGTSADAGAPEDVGEKAPEAAPSAAPAAAPRAPKGKGR